MWQSELIGCVLPCWSKCYSYLITSITDSAECDLCAKLPCFIIPFMPIIFQRGHPLLSQSASQWCSDSLIPISTQSAASCFLFLVSVNMLIRLISYSQLIKQRARVMLRIVSEVSAELGSPNMSRSCLVRISLRWSGVSLWMQNEDWFWKASVFMQVIKAPHSVSTLFWVFV